MLMHKSGEWSERTFINQTHYLTQSTADSNYIFDAVISDFKLTAAHFDSVELKYQYSPLPIGFWLKWVRFMNVYK